MPKKEIKKQTKPKRTRGSKGPIFKVVKPSVVSHRQPSQSLSSEEKIVSLMNKQAADNLRQQQTLLGSLVSSIGALIPSTAKATASQMPKVETGLPSVNAELLKAAKTYEEAKRRHDYLKQQEEEHKTKYGERPRYTEKGKKILEKKAFGYIVEDPFKNYKPSPPPKSSSESETEYSSSDFY